MPENGCHPISCRTNAQPKKIWQIVFGVLHDHPILEKQHAIVLLKLTICCLESDDRNFKLLSILLYISISWPRHPIQFFLHESKAENVQCGCARWSSWPACWITSSNPWIRKQFAQEAGSACNVRRSSILLKNAFCRISWASGRM